MRMTGLGKWLSDNAVGIVALAVETGALAGVLGEWGAVASFASSDPVGFWALTLSMATAGFLLCDLSGLRSYNVERYRRRSERDSRAERVSRMCRTLSPRQRSMLSEVLEHGSRTYDILDRDAQALAESGLTVPSRMAATDGKLMLHVDPGCVDELSVHRSEWLAP
jgi:hypothetical protein